MMWGLVVVALLVGVFIGFSVEKQRATDKMEAFKMVMQNQLDDAKMKANNAAAVSAQDAMMKQKENIMMMAQQDTKSKKATLTDVSGGNAKGVAFILRKDGKLYFTASGNLSDPTNGSFYEGWLVKKGSKPVAYVDTGKLAKQKDGSYEVSYSSDELYDGYDLVVITWEQIDDQKPEKHILEGTAQ